MTLGARAARNGRLVRARHVVLTVLFLAAVVALWRTVCSERGSGLAGGTAAAFALVTSPVGEDYDRQVEEFLAGGPETVREALLAYDALTAGPHTSDEEGRIHELCVRATDRYPRALVAALRDTRPEVWGAAVECICGGAGRRADAEVKREIEGLVNAIGQTYPAWRQRADFAVEILWRDR
jgi:hypothetical protein